MGIKHSTDEPHRCNSLRTSNRQKEVTFCPLVTINTFPPTQSEQNPARFQDNTNYKGVPMINTNGRVCFERRVQQRIYHLGVLSYQKRSQEITSGQAVPASESRLLLSKVCIKFSQRAKDLALETARRTFLEVYPHAISSSNMLPINISKFPQVKEKRKRELPRQLLGFGPELKRPRQPTGLI